MKVHSTNNGNPDKSGRRGKAPHKGGYHAAKGDDKNCYPRQSWSPSVYYPNGEVNTAGSK